VARRRGETHAEQRERRGAVDDPELVLAAALRFLEARARSVAEVRRRLIQAGYQPALVEGAIARLVDLRMLDDEAFARSWVESRDRARPRGQRALRQELAVKGIERSVVAALLEERAGLDGAAERDVAAAVALLERHRRPLERDADPRHRRQKAYALLARHGFDAETCADAIRRSWMTTPVDESDGDGVP
jgi:regulatory protein